MKKLPRKNKHWAEEAVRARDQAIANLRVKHATLTDENVLELIAAAPLFAANNRGLTNKDKLSQSQDNAITTLASDIARLDPGEPLEHSVCFLLAYLDAHVFHGYITKTKAEDIMEYLTEHYEVLVPVF